MRCENGGYDKKTEMMKIKRCIYIITLFVVCCIVSCKNSENDEIRYKEGHKELTQEEIRIRALDDREYLMEVYGLTAKDLENINIDFFSDVVDLRRSKPSKDRLKIVLDELRERFIDENYSDIYLILSPETNKKIPQGTKVKKIGYYINPGTFVQKMVFDLEKKVFYVDDYTEYKFDEDLANVVDDYKIYEWDTYVVGENDKNSTGSYGFKMVLLGEDDHKYAYEGHGESNLPIPDEYWILGKKLTDIAETRYSQMTAPWIDVTE